MPTQMINQHREQSTSGTEPCSAYVLKHFEKPCIPKKKHECRLCGEIIKEKEQCCRWTGFYDGPFTSHAHPECYNTMENESVDAWESLLPGDLERPSVKMYWPNNKPHKDQQPTMNTNNEDQTQELNIEIFTNTLNAVGIIQDSVFEKESEFTAKFCKGVVSSLAGFWFGAENCKIVYIQESGIHISDTIPTREVCEFLINQINQTNQKP